MKEPKWLKLEIVVAMQGELLAEHGGRSGIRDRGLLESALARPQNLWAYEKADLPRLAAAYAFGLAKNHPFVDGNKRVAFGALVLFLARNAVTFEVDDDEAIAMILNLAANEVTEQQLGEWIRGKM